MCGLDLVQGQVWHKDQEMRGFVPSKGDDSRHPEKASLDNEEVEAAPLTNEQVRAPHPSHSVPASVPARPCPRPRPEGFIFLAVALTYVRRGARAAYSSSRSWTSTTMASSAKRSGR